MTEAEAPRPLAGLRVLVIEDELLLAMSLEAALSAEGCTVIGPVARVARALALAERERLDLAVMDLNLGGESPVAAAEALRQRGVPFVLLTGYTRAPAEVPAFRDVPCLSKPVAQADLVGALARAVGAA